MTLDVIAPYLTLATLAICAFMPVAFWLSSLGDEKRRQERVRRVIGTHVSEMLKILQVLHDRANGADHNLQRAHAASTYFDRNVHRLESLRVCIEGLLPTIEDEEYDDGGYSGAVRRILGVEAWLVERYYSPNSPAGERSGLWTTNTVNVVEQVEYAVTAAASINVSAAGRGAAG